MTEQASPVQGSIASQVNLVSTKKVVKRLFDITASGFGLLLLSPIFLLIGILIRRDSPGPVFYRGPRMGMGGKPFKILKFRTMYERKESYQGPPITASDDNRITPIGRWLRDTKLNELPQLWNVLVGEMSLVGPRPEDPGIAARWPKQAFDEVLSVRPGITSPASVLYRKEESLLQSHTVIASYLDTIQPSKLRLDQLYVRHHSLWLDLDIICWTFIVLLPRLKKFNPPEESLFWGPVSRLFTHYLDWFLIDTLVTFAALGVAGSFWRLLGPLNIGWPYAILTALGFALLFSLAGVLTGVNRITWSQALASDALDLIPSVLLATLVAFAGNYFWAPQRLPPLMILSAASLSFMGFVVLRYRSRLLTGFSSRWLAWRGGGRAAKERALIVGGGESGQLVAWMLSISHNASLYRLVGFVDDDLYKQGARIRGVKVLGARRDIAQLVAQYDIGIIFFAIHNISGEARRQLLAMCASTPARVAVVPDVLKAVWSVAGSEGAPAGGNGRHAREKAQAAPAVVELLDFFGTLPNEPGLMGTAPLHTVNTWLADLDDTAKAGDLETLRMKIQRLQEQFQSE
jgi:lipopolysaccharide/colanic/teichoic acid biosynthesis glycosyltransferase